MIVSILMLKVIPAFKEIFDTLGADLPLLTRLLIGFSTFAQRAFFPGLGLLFVGGMVFRRALRTPRGQRRLDRFLLSLGIIGPIIRKVAVAKFARTLATLVRSGVQIIAALEIVADTAGNRVVSDAVLRVSSSIREGENIATPLASSGVFPSLVVRMIAVGEQTGRLEDMLTKVADFYEDQVDAAVGGLTNALEPVIICVLGIIVGAIVMAIFLPIFKLTQVLGK